MRGAWTLSLTLSSQRESGKHATVISGGRGITDFDTKPQCCNYCGTEQNGLTIWKCSGCRLAKYCNTSCQKKHWPSHKAVCHAVQTLGNASARNIKYSNFVTHLTPKQSSQIAKLVGNQCTITCELNGNFVEVLWDTGAQVSIISQKYLNSRFPGIKLKNISELIDCELDLTAANGTNISYKGFVELTFKLKSEQDTIVVPFLVTTDDISLPIIGYNVIELCVKSGMTSPDLACVFASLSHENVNSLYNIFEANDDTDFCTVRTNKTNI